MFTGIVEELGQIRKIQKGRSSAVLEIEARKVLEGTRVGDSICVSGVCLTVTSLEGGRFTADVMHETLNRSALQNARSGSLVNLERAMAADGRFGGHIVAGHVDGTGRIRGIERDDNAVWYTIEAGDEILRYVVEKGSIAIDGISLTVARVGEGWFSISAIPHTIRETTLQAKHQGDLVNLENDVIGKYVEKLLGLAPAGGQTGEKSRITREFLSRYGF